MCTVSTLKGSCSIKLVNRCIAFRKTPVKCHNTHVTCYICYITHMLLTIRIRTYCCGRLRWRTTRTDLNLGEEGEKHGGKKAAEEKPEREWTSRQLWKVSPKERERFVQRSCCPNWHTLERARAPKTASCTWGWEKAKLQVKERLSSAQPGLQTRAFLYEAIHHLS